jgi:hypothetical protein
VAKDLKEYEGVRQRMGIPRTMDIELGEHDNIFIARFWEAVQVTNAQLYVMDQEIARRNKLIGVMG